MGLGRDIEESLETMFGSTYKNSDCGDVLISKRVENILENEGRGGNMVVAANVLPLFLTSNALSINHFLLNGGGSLEIITQNPSSLYNSILSDFSIMDGHRIDNGKINVYHAKKRIKYEFAVLWNYTIIFDDKEFKLFNNNKTKKRCYLNIFEEMKKSPYVEEFNYVPPRPIVRI